MLRKEKWSAPLGTTEGHEKERYMKPGMKHLKFTACAIGTVLAVLVADLQAQQVPIPTTAAEVPGPTSGPTTQASVQMVGRMAYVWGRPP